MAQPADVPNGMTVSGKRDRDDLDLAVTEALDHEPGAQRRRVADEFGEWHAWLLYHDLITRGASAFQTPFLGATLRWKLAWP